ncbi:hypothetical protein V2S66_30335 [Streptomyces sp. V4-01]|uniref:DUF4913 domain-containing protein n=1 Tax=Actinacidiphila polyblastidii TaxID=3110430 RepID=A0ABU7PKJ5_9ACTN|nr:hypothetical protein [Streptomyces sp. V4-01]
MTGRAAGDADARYASLLQRLHAVTRDSERQQTEIDRLRQDVHLLLSEVDRAFRTLTGRLDEAMGAADKHGPRFRDGLGAQPVRAAVAEWLGWLHTRYPLADDLPACWWRHPAAVDTVTALHNAWSAAYEGAGADGRAQLEWQTRWLPAALTAVRAWLPASCFQGAHSDDPAARYGRAVDDPDAFDAQVRPSSSPGPPPP